MATQVNLHSGAATFSYPLELPPGPGGFQPRIELTYNSASVDEMKNKRDMGSWVGIGWNLQLGRISLDTLGKKYYLELNGASYELVALDETNYKTNPDQYFKITRSGNTWTMYDRKDIYTSLAALLIQNNISMISSTAGSQPISGYQRNQATISYTRDIHETSTHCVVRSAYPEYLRYNNDQIEVHFISVYDEENDTDGYIRWDNPKSYGTNPAPKIMETRKLDGIEIKVNDNLVRKYGLTYNTNLSDSDINRVYSSQYGGIYYSGKLKLLSITQYGANGVSSLRLPVLPTRIYRHTVVLVNRLIVGIPAIQPNSPGRI
jgi:hypothetical protein